AERAPAVGRGGDHRGHGSLDAANLGARGHRFQVASRIGQERVLILLVETNQSAQQRPRVATVAARVRPAGSVYADTHLSYLTLASASPGPKRWPTASPTAHDATKSARRGSDNTNLRR